MENQQVVYRGCGLGTMVFIVFLVLKLLLSGGVITGDFAWLTWFWVFFPLWIGPAIYIVVIGIIIVIAAVLKKL
jgi:hypothetical protein